ncbi:MAG: MFS transporter [Candidatus Omnitrophica bacterium]|nr:MFS transporter [Candidatus Omnitrophota bacterium]
MVKTKSRFLKEKNFALSLTLQEKAEGRRLYLKFGLLNGISVACLLESILILYAIRNGLSAPAVAVLASFVHLSMPFMVAGKTMVSRIGLAQTWALGWFFRYVSASLMVIAPQAGKAVSQQAVTTLIMAGAFGFALFRSIGSIAATPLAGEITDPAERGIFLSGFTMRINITHLLTMLLIAFILKYSDALWIYQLILISGCIAGFYASTVLAGIPESSAPRISAQRPLSYSLSGIWKFEKTRRLLFAWCAGFVAFTLIVPFMIISVKNGYGVSDFTVLVFSAFLLIGGILSATINGFIADRAGPRSLLILYVIGLFIVTSYWAFSPADFLMVPALLSFFTAGFCKTGIIICLSHAFLNVVEDSHRVGSILIMRILSGVAAGISGAFLGGGILYILGIFGLEGLPLYRTYFQIMLLVLFFLLAVIRRLKPQRDWSVKKVLGLLFPPWEM